MKLFYTSSLAKAALCAVFAVLLCSSIFAQSTGNSRSPLRSSGQNAALGPKITQIDIEGLKKLLKPNGRPLLINFWATWCDPCREEFPDLVKLDATYKGKLDIITVSLDDLDDIDTVVPKFLRDQKATMPAYLLRTPDESAAIQMVAEEWSGSLPLTVIYSSTGDRAYTRMGKIRLDAVTAEIEKLILPLTK
jgi:thiol-disulfide isomerase/thioredoxin